jgi:medium-chain acyl-[acyl-carrier-protein] hydrolase
MNIGMKTTHWLTCPRPNSRAGLRLFCFPYAGGRAAIFRQWPDSLPTTVEMYAVEYPGRGARLTEPPLTRITCLVQAAADALLPYLDKPFVFFGHSMGAMISFELARWLRQEQSLGPVQLFVSGRRAPHSPNTDRPTYDLPDDEFLEELRRLNGTPKEVLDHAELMRLILPIVRADFEAIQTYRYLPGAPLDCPITAFGGLGDQEVNREHLEAWREHTTAGFALRMFPGDHFFLHTAQRVLLQTLSQDLHQLVAGLTRKLGVVR